MAMPVAAPKPSPAAATPTPAPSRKAPTIPQLYQHAATSIDQGVNRLANADAAGVWGTKDAASYISGMKEAFGSAADAFQVANLAMKPAQREKLDALKFRLASAQQYTRMEGDGRGLVSRYNNRSDSLFGGVTAVSYALFLKGAADDARSAAALLS